MHKVVLAFDSFKGSVDAVDITSNLIDEIHHYWPNCEVLSFPIADGGEGTMQVIEKCVSVQRYACQVNGPLQEKLMASYIITDQQVAIIEMAAANGLPLVAPNLRNPMETTTIGTGELISDALNRGCRNFVIGLGGSATNDAGIGVMYALGVRFLDDKGKELTPKGKNLGRIRTIDTSHMRSEVAESKFIFACDVTNPFYGKQGAAYVYAPQKGATEEQVVFLDKGLCSYANLLLEETGFDVAQLPGAGAAGGMAGGLLPFLHGEIKSGIDIILDLVGFDKALQDTDIVLAGEGKIDAQTGMGKALSGVLKRSLSAGVPVVGIGGCIEDAELLNQLGFTALFSIQSSPIDLEKTIQKDIALRNLKRTVIQVLRLMNSKCF